MGRAVTVQTTTQLSLLRTWEWVVLDVGHGMLHGLNEGWSEARGEREHRRMESDRPGRKYVVRVHDGVTVATTAEAAALLAGEALAAA